MKIYIFREGWKSLLSGYRGGVDYPVSHFYKEILEVYPNAKVLLNVRDPEKWFVSVRDSILESMTVQNSWPCTWLSHILGLRENTRLIWDLSDPVPTSSSQGKDRKGFFSSIVFLIKGLGLFSAVKKGKESAVKFYHDHVEEVKKHVPEDQLLVFEVKTFYY